ncbi:amidophosphoribosyltransferase [Clostridium fallax]|uniref:Amidophosphoribosyltransferase n=1 Tax=Clostridium fallax TaxID=1533 RepID=A0A1M4WA98_9CLOT|nr:amidophosphoribosyltransferase [Clostridium fallax]SHE78003.1 amidophosphoribosyltransferase [Clostridium fallax]SQB05934.1 amidophosphoribosyltransferase [Clostridium fallax]
MRESIVDLSVDKFKDECGVFGVYGRDEVDVASLTYYGLYALQHRGEESAGIAVLNDKKIDIHKGMGLVSDVFNEKSLKSLKGKAAIGHVRYSTTGDSCASNVQPLFTKGKLGNMAIAHNGNLVNSEVIRELLEDSGFIFQSSVDSEVILGIMARYANKGLEKAIVSAMEMIKGSFAVVILAEDKLIGLRDHNGIRPLCIGKLNNSYILTSESCALDSVGAEFIRDVEPGEIVIIDENGIKTLNYSEKTNTATCAFEYIYFARPDSTIDGINVYKSRVKAGEILFKESPVDADIVIGVPDSGLPAAVGFSKASGIPYETGFVKNKYVGRSFIAPSKYLREKAVSIKLNPLKPLIEGKRVVIIDDSIVRGTTSKKLVQQLKKAGAREIHFRISSPVVKYPCYFGIDTPYRSELIGATKTIDEIKDILEVDSIAYLSVEGLLESFGDKNHGFCLGCFNGEYPVAAPNKSNDM